jgi:hypothetical protein
MHARKIRIAVTFLTVPAILFFLTQAGAVGVLLLMREDAPVSPWLGFIAFGVGLAAFLCSGPGLVALCRSDIRGLPRYMLMGIHALWFVIGGLLLLAALFIKVIFPLFQRWVAD